ncbi:MAG: nucleotidyltransferase family protein [Paludibacter sp.]
MKDFSKYIINQSFSILEALIHLNELSSDSLTLFVIDNSGRMVGTLTDGDIRRKLIEGVLMTDIVANVMQKNFSFIGNSESNQVAKIRQFKDNGITLIPLLDNNYQLLKVFNLKKYQSILPFEAILMAGGKGERLRPLTEKMPKPLLPVGNKAIIDYNIEQLISYGVDHISVTVNYLKEQIEEHFIQPKNGVQINCVREPKFLGTIGSIKFVDLTIQDTVLVMNSDLFTNINYEDFYLHFLENDADMSVAAVPYSVNIPYGIFDLEGRNIKGLVEKPIYNHYANAGIYLIKKEMLTFIPDDTYFNATDLIELLIKKNKKIIRFPLIGYWLDIGTHDEYKKAQELSKHIMF